MWANKNKAELKYTYQSAGPMHSPSFRGSLTVFVRELGRTLTAREAASTKHSASKSCALSVVRQMFHLGVMEVRLSLDDQTRPSAFKRPLSV
jgi:ATP-dependent RNA helicase A